MGGGWCGVATNEVARPGRPPPIPPISPVSTCPACHAAHSPLVTSSPLPAQLTINSRSVQSVQARELKHGAVWGLQASTGLQEPGPALRCSMGCWWITSVKSSDPSREDHIEWKQVHDPSIEVVFNVRHLFCHHLLVEARKCVVTLVKANKL